MLLTSLKDESSNMPRPRRQQISLSDTPYYHCVSRCVRRAFLCGKDAQTGQSFEHRRAWVEDRLLVLGDIFAIDICAYTVMSNHTHVVLFVDEKKALAWTTKQVIEQWHKLYSGTLFTQQYTQGAECSEVVINTVNEIAEVYRQRLMDISWFMRSLNEPIARMANLEDECTGRFWEGRFKSQALLDGSALVACMAYVDLNPVRAKIANTPEASKHTSIHARAIDAKKGKQPKTLANFIGNPRKGMPKGLPFELTDYLELVELTGRCIREDKRGAISDINAPILERLTIQPENWLKLTTQFESYFTGAVGAPNLLSDFCNHQKLKRRHQINHCQNLFNGSQR